MTEIKTPNRGRRVLRALSALGIVLVGVLFTLFMAANRPAPPQRPTQDTALLVEVMEAHPQPVTFEVESRGNVTPRTETVVVAQVSGRIVEVSNRFVAGGFFNQGERLLRIDPSDYEVAVRRAEAELAGRSAQLASETARAEQALKDWRSVGKGQPSDLVLRKPQLAEARAAVTAAEADLDRARRDLERTEISLPYTGLVKSKAVDIGQFVNVGTTLGNTFAVDYAEVRLPLTDADLAFVELPGTQHFSDPGFVGPTVELTATVGERVLVWHGHIVRTEGVIDPRNRVIYAVARVPDPYNLAGPTHPEPLKIGQFVAATIQGVQMDRLTTLPRHALQGRDQLLVADNDDFLRQRQVEVVRADEQHVYIASGLNEGDRVITTAVDAPIDGTPIRTPEMKAPGEPSLGTDEEPAEAISQAPAAGD